MGRGRRGRERGREGEGEGEGGGEGEGDFGMESRCKNLQVEYVELGKTFQALDCHYPENTAQHLGTFQCDCQILGWLLHRPSCKSTLREDWKVFNGLEMSVVTGLNPA